MSSPSNASGNNSSVSIREGTRVILREITANLQNSPPDQSPRRKNGNEAASIKGEQRHDVKVRFIREFADAGALGRDANTESSLSSASSFQSLASTLSSKCSSGICVDSSPTKASETSYRIADIPGLDEIISACENIRLDDKTLDLSKDRSFDLHLDGEDLSDDQTFTSATDRNSLDRTRELSPVNSQPEVIRELDSTRTIDGDTETSVANAFFECAAVNAAEATQYRQTDSELGSVNENFVQCVSNLAQIDSAIDEKNARDDVEETELDKIVETHESLEILVENKNNDELQINKIDNVGISSPSLEGFAENSIINLKSLSNIIVDDAALLLKEIESVETSQRCEVTEKSTQSILNVTVEVPSDLKEIGDIEPSNFDEKEKIPLESLSKIVADDITSVERVECYKPSISTISELNENSQCPSLPTLSSVCLRATLTEIDAPLTEQSAENTGNTEATVPTVAIPSLSEKFDNIAANDTSQGNSISTVKEPTFLNAQKLVEDSVELEENESAVKTKNLILSVENIDEIANTEQKIVKNIENPIIPSEIEFCEFKKPEPPKEGVENKVLSSEQPKTEEKERKTKKIDKVETEKEIFREIVDDHEANSSANSDDLDDTISIQDISAGNIFAIPESDQYAEFQPQQRSTALTLERTPTVDSNASGLVAGAELISGDNLVVSKPISLPSEYAAFVPQQRSTSLTGFDDRSLGKLERQPTPFVTASLSPLKTTFNDKIPKSTLPIDDRCNFAKLELAAKAVANDIYNTSLELEDESSERFVSATSELFHDPRSFDFLLSKTPRKNTRRDLRAESLYVKFDPLVSNTSMLPHGNIQATSLSVNEEQNGDDDTTVTSIGTPKRNPAIAAIDRLLFYSPMTTVTTPTTNTTTIQKTNDSQEKVEPTEETSAETVNMAKELEVVRSTVIQLEEQVEKLKIDNEEALEKQSSYQEKINQLQTQLAQEIKNKNQITVVVDEYEKSISRLVAERERDRKNLDLEKAKLQEELAAVKHHLENTEAAFNDVHLKYERLKAVVATYKSNEAALKQSVQENVEIIKSLENRYEQVKEHATARLEKANQDLDTIRKQNESETVKLHAMLRKAELKSNSLAELVEQKTKENKELAQILDELIARVGRNKSE